MENEVITLKNENIQELLNGIELALELVDGLLENQKPYLNGERFVSDRELSELLKISRRTLHQHRNDRVLSYYQLGGKTLYRESDIQKILDENYKL